MAKHRPLTINEATGVGYIEVRQTKRGGHEGRGPARVTSGGAKLLDQLLKGGNAVFTGSVFYQGVESRRRLEVIVERFDGQDATLVPSIDPLLAEEVDDL